MGPVFVRAIAGLRTRRAAAAMLMLLLGLALAVVLASVAGGRRGASALDRFRAANREGTLSAYVSPDLPVREQLATLRRMGAVAGAERASGASAVVVGVAGPEGPSDLRSFVVVAEAALDDRWLIEVSRPIVLEGALPLRAGDVAVDEAFARRRGVGVGDTVRLSLFSPDQLEEVGGGALPTPFTTVEVSIAAVVRQPKDLARNPQAQARTVFEADEASLTLDPTFFDTWGEQVASYGMGLLDQPSDVATVAERMRTAGGEQTLVYEGPAEDLQVLEPVDDAIALESNALVGFGALVAAAALVLLGPALGRLAGEAPEDRLALVAIGCSTRQLVAIRVVRAGAVAVGATALGLLAAIPLSALLPIGLAHAAEVDPGVSLDGPVLVVGGLAALALLTARGVVREGPTAARRASRLSAAVAGSGVPPPVALGVDLAIDAASGRSRTTSPAAILAAVIGVVAVVGAATFGASLDHLSGSPRLQGWTWDVVVGNYSQSDTAAVGAAALTRSPDVEVFSGYDWVLIDIDGRPVNIVGFDEGARDFAPVVLAGRAAAAADEIALGRGTLTELGKSIGDEVQIQGAGAVTAVRIVGEIVAPAVLAYGMDLDSGAAMTLDGLSAALGDARDDSGPASHLVAFADGVDPTAARERLRADFPGTVLDPMAPVDLRDLERVRGMPYLLASLLGFMALGSIVVMLLTVARRRRRDVAVLRAVGFEGRDIRRMLAAQAATVALLALGVGVPLGVVVGRGAWLLAADGLGTEVGPRVPMLTIAIASAGVVVLAHLAARAFSIRVGRRPVGPSLRVE